MATPTVANVLLPALALGYAIPSILMFLPGPGNNRPSLWRVVPPLFNVVTYALAKWRPASDKTSPKAKFEEELDARYSNADLPHLQKAYLVTAGIQATVHIATLAYAWRRPTLGLAGVHVSVRAAGVVADLVEVVGVLHRRQTHLELERRVGRRPGPDVPRSLENDAGNALGEPTPRASSASGVPGRRHAAARHGVATGMAPMTYSTAMPKLQPPLVS